MSLTYANRVKETCTVIGTSNPYALAGAEAGFLAFSANVANAATCTYVAVGRTTNAWEVGTGTYASSGNTLARTAIESSSNSNSAVNWTAETIDIFIDVSASLFTNLPVPAASSDIITGTDNAKFTTSLALRNANVWPGVPIDHTADSVDYALNPGQTISKSFSGATSILLYIASGPAGLYEITLSCNVTTASSNSNCFLNPNNTTYSSVFKRMGFYVTCATGASGVSSSTTDTAIKIGEARVLYCILKISTNTLSKWVSAVEMNIDNTGAYYWEQYDVLWNDTTTAWSSLGTISLSNSSTGTIVITRIL